MSNSSQRATVGLRWVTVGLALVTIGLMAFLRPGALPRGDFEEVAFADDVRRAEVLAVEPISCGGESDTDCLVVGFEVAEGPDRGLIVRQQFAVAPSTPDFEVGTKVILNFVEGAPTDLAYQYADQDRLGVIVVAALAFGAAVVALGRWKGVTALVGVGASIAVIFWFILPALLTGGPPVMVAVVGAAAIAFATLWLTHGFNPFTNVALVGTLGALALTAVLSEVVFAAARISGYASEEAFFLALLPGRVNASGIVLAGAVLGALGALDDVTITQTSAVWEVRAANPAMTRRELAAAGLRVGRDHIASTVNTLVLAYAGASMPLLILFLFSNLTAGEVINSEVVAIEVIRTLVGSIGLVSAVPITTWLASIVARSLPPQAAIHRH